MGFPYFIFNVAIVGAAYAIGGKSLAVIALWCWALLIGVGMIAVGLRKLSSESVPAGAILALMGSGLTALSAHHISETWRRESGIIILAMVAVSAISLVVHLITKK